jgi:hypothetical protein
MLSEEALILLATLAAFALLALGIWEHVSPARPRYPERRPSPSIDRRLTPVRGPAEAMAPAAGEEVVDGDDQRRLWRSYMNLGARSLEEGRVESALDPLVRALRMRVGPDRALETRATLVRALEALVAEGASVVSRHVDHGQREAARAAAEKLAVQLRTATDRGLPEEDVVELAARVRRLLEHTALAGS